jgi:hypothetical protein
MLYFSNFLIDLEMYRLHTSFTSTVLMLFLHICSLHYIKIFSEEVKYSFYSIGLDLHTKQMEAYLYGTEAKQAE